MDSLSVEKEKRREKPMEAKKRNEFEFERFDVVTDDSDHYFRNRSKCKSWNNTKSKAYKTIMREWKILEKNLPESIYVRVYEGRIDIMRAVIVGAEGTPYQDGLFFFDIIFPSNYPYTPPLLHYHSFGYRLNPNLYNHGKVCLSLLNTWEGKQREKWDPSQSTMLQVLVSIQALVLNEKPYFNEPGLPQFIHSGNKFNDSSRLYNETAYLRTCQTSYLLLQRPPRHFEAFIRAHFRHRASRIIETCNLYMSGRVRFGNYSCESSPSSSARIRVSSSFKSAMKGFLPGFVRVLRKNGIKVDNADYGRKEESDNDRKEEGDHDRKEEGANKDGGFFKTLMKKIKQSFPWKKIGKKNVK